MFRPKNTQERILHRLKISQGHLDKIIQMVEEQSYCIDIIHQSQAVQQALRETDDLILENHFRTCVAKAIRKGNDKDVIAEIMQVVKKSSI